MLFDYYKQFKIIRNTLEEANETLNFNLWNIIKYNDKKLNQSQYAQPAILTASISIWRLLKSLKNISPALLAGHSLGEYSALVSSKCITFHNAIKLVQLRGMLMQHSVKNKNTV